MAQAQAERDESEYWRDEKYMAEDHMPRDSVLRNRIALFPMHPDFERWKQELQDYEHVASPWEVDDLVAQLENRYADGHDTVHDQRNHPGDRVW
jgi:hypothetical protein